jgi:hypothetical protein
MMTGFEQYARKTRASDISGGDGVGGAVARIVRSGGTALSQAWERAGRRWEWNAFLHTVDSIRAHCRQ